MSKIDDIAKAVESGKSKIAEGLVTEALNEGIDPVKILNEGLLQAMDRVGGKFQKGGAPAGGNRRNFNNGNRDNRGGRKTR